MRYGDFVFLRKAALRAVPGYAVVNEHALEALERALDVEPDTLQETLDIGFREMDAKQPELTAYLADQVAERGDELAQSLGYFLAITVFMAFYEAFGLRLERVDESALSLALETLAADEELRANDPFEALDSDDVIAMSQPVVIDFVQHHMQEALNQAEEGTDTDELDHVYRAILVEVVALSHAVVAPAGEINHAWA